MDWRPSGGQDLFGLVFTDVLYVDSHDFPRSGRHRRCGYRPVRCCERWGSPAPGRDGCGRGQSLGGGVSRVPREAWGVDSACLLCRKNLLIRKFGIVVQSLGLRSPHLAAMVLPGFPAWELTLPGLPLTRVCKNEIIATDRPRHPWIPAYAGMTEWAR